MIVYVDPRLIGRTNYNSLVKQYPNIEFVTDTEQHAEIEVLFAMPKLVKEMKLSDYPKLKWIQYLMAGYDGVDLEILNKNNIIFCNAQDIFSKSIAEDVITKMLYFNRNVKHYMESMKEQKWEPIKEEPELTNSTALILGVGSIGKELAKRLQAFEMNVIGYRSTMKPEENFDKIITSKAKLDEALGIADYVVLALPLNEKTLHMFDKSKFDMMKETALFINVARGKVVNQDDMYVALKNNKIRGAGLDVLDPEPLPSDHPLWKLENVYITPHNASSSPFMRERLFQLIQMNLNLYLAKKPVKYQIK